MLLLAPLACAMPSTPYTQLDQRYATLLLQTSTCLWATAYSDAESCGDGDLIELMAARGARRAAQRHDGVAREREAGGRLAQASSAARELLV